MIYILKLLIVVIVLCLFIGANKDTRQHGGSKSSDLDGWYRDKQCNYQLMHVLQTFVRANNMNKNTTDNWSVYLPCGYNNSEKEFHSLQSTDKKQKIFIIKGCDNISRKDTLWQNLREEYGDHAKDLMPQTYLLRNQKDLQELSDAFNPNKVYILKKNIQRQEGLKITKDKNELLQGAKNGYVVAQEMLQDPYILDGRKTNCRVYLLIVCINGKKTGYIYNNGFMYYTPQPFKMGSMEIDRVITAGLSTTRKDSEFYKTHPLTIQELQTQIGQEIDLFARIGELMAQVLKASAPKFCNTERLRDRTTFQLFGCDIAFNNKLKPQLIEINKGPDLSSKSKKESLLKDDLMANIFNEVGVPVKKPFPSNGKLLKI